MKPINFHVSDLGQVYLFYDGMIVECEQHRHADGTKLVPIAKMILPTNKEILYVSSENAEGQGDGEEGPEENQETSQA